MFTRRAFLASAGAMVGSAAFAGAKVLPAPARALGPAVSPAAEGVKEITLSAAERPFALPCFGGRTVQLWTFREGAFPPVVRMKLGETLRAHVENLIPREGEHITVHWHGIRLPNAQDGVPYVTQRPIEPGESFDYEFTPPDTGTFFFHTHCNTAEQLERGLAGVLIIEGDETEPYDGERLIVLRDWSIGPDGGIGSFYSAEGAGRAGTFGEIRTANGAVNPTLNVPSAADIRLRILNVDRTRITQLGIEGAECAVVAVDGIAVPPFPLKAWRAGPAMRLDVVMRTPAPGGSATLYDYYAAEPVPLATFCTEGPPLRSRDFDPAPLRAAIIPEPGMADAEHLRFDFSAAVGAPVPVTGGAPETGKFIGELCLAPQTFWAINKQSWPGRDHSTVPPPLATLTRGRSYVFTLANATPHIHPIHIHGHSFKVLKSNKRNLPVHHADTVLLMPKERVEVAFVADNPGDWMFHCHIIEHQETGMMGILRVA
ncbi:multicopper oxidase family protein [Propylenella binzhouense]|uniref:Multicopper oxidase family protein n=1 Tax=Propylenella binzhouense TaxID=2555902 RepID=A0A964WUQ4_9HYPH|nr:multicopper oxidase family protein [Propylenella binzhouense]MYZ49263.1 multicopper oxidase family protein [Propylenella binzhouense]